jgi:uncharacterized damage-inducible protein DinB
MGTSLSTIKMLFDYNLWANERMLVACESLTLEQWSRNLGHSWGNVHGLLTHMFAAEVIWLSRLKGESPKKLHQAAEFPTFGELERAWVQGELDLKQFIDSLDEKDLSREVTYTNTKGETYTNYLGHLLLHLANHNNHHRGELAAMLAVLNVPHPEDDLLFYLREKANHKNGK